MWGALRPVSSPQQAGRHPAGSSRASAVAGIDDFGRNYSRTMRILASASLQTEVPRILLFSSDAAAQDCTHSFTRGLALAFAKRVHQTFSRGFIYLSDYRSRDTSVRFGGYTKIRRSTTVNNG